MSRATRQVTRKQPAVLASSLANFAMKLSEKSHERANLLAIKRLIAT
jgi:hypothetical protein